VVEALPNDVTTDPPLFDRVNSAVVFVTVIFPPVEIVPRMLAEAVRLRSSILRNGA
jgi:hypothetical protein